MRRLTQIVARDRLAGTVLFRAGRTRIHELLCRIAVASGRSLASMLTASVVLFCDGGSRAEPIARSVLVLDEAGPGALNPGYAEISRAFRESLTARTPARIHATNLDLGAFSGPAYRAILKGFLGDKYRDVPIGVLVAVGSAALEFAIEVRDAHWPDVPIVFAGAAVDTVARIVASPVGNITGRTLYVSPSRLIETARALVPNLKHIALVGDPLEKQLVRRHFRQQLPQVAQGLTLIDLTGLPLAGVKERLAALPHDTAVLYTAITGDGAGNTLIPHEIVQVIAEVANRPVVVDIDNRIGRGGTGGPVVRPALLGHEAAQLVDRIFAGERASQIPIEPSGAVRPVFDWRQLERWGVSATSLPPDSEILFREYSVWERYRTEIALVIIAILFQSVLIAILLYEDRMRRLAEARSLELASELAHVNRVATAGELAAAIAHEIRQPLAAIVARGSAGLNWLKRDVPDLDKARSALEGIVENGHRADQVLRNTRAMFGNGDAPQESLNVDLVIREVLALISAKLMENNVKLETSYAEDPAPIVRANRVQLQQVLLNLTMNAIEAMSGVRGAPRILTLATEIHRPGHVLIMVRDSGPGIAADQLDVIFKSFFTTKPEGMGVGLSICKTIIEAHGGVLQAIRGEPTGMVFTIDLPLLVKRTRTTVEDMVVADAPDTVPQPDLGATDPTKTNLTKSDAA